MLEPPVSTEEGNEEIVGNIFKFKPLDLKFGDLDLDALYKFIKQWVNEQNEGNS